MSFSEFRHKIPSFCLLIPLVAGIMVGDASFFAGWLFSGFFLSGLILVCLLGAVCSFFLRGYSSRWLFGIFVGCFFFFFGWGWGGWRLQQTLYPFQRTEEVYKVIISGKPEAKANSIQCSANWRDKKLLLYFPVDSVAASLGSGDELLVAARLSLPDPPQNPDEFDYRRYLLRKGISATGYVGDGKWRFLEHHNDYSLKQLGLECRAWILRLFKELGFSEDEFSILSALTIGYKEELSEEIRESFSVAGISHILALSGLHVGIVYGLLFFVLQRVTPSRGFFPLLRIGIIILFLWAFAFITGLSASVVRSAIMFSLLTVSAQLRKNRVPLNTVLFTALFMLCYEPGWLFDVGFQLSFAAVIAILLIQPKLYNLLPAHTVLWKFVWSSITVSVAAQIGTTPLVLFYFSRFPTHFLLSNLLVVPVLIPAILYAVILMLVLTPLPALQSWVVMLVKELLFVLVKIVRIVESLPYSSIDNVWVYPLELILLYLLFFMSGVFLLKRRAKYFIATLTVVLTLLGYRLYAGGRDKPFDCLVFYQVRNCPVVHCISSSGKSWLSFMDSIPNQKNLRRATSNYWNRLQLSEPQSVMDDYETGALIRKGPVVSFGTKRVAAINDSSWAGKSSSDPLRVDYLYVCNGYNGKLSMLLKLFSVKQVVLDASLSEYKREKMKEECELLHLPCYSLSDGYLLVRL